MNIENMDSPTLEVLLTIFSSPQTELEFKGEFPLLYSNWKQAWKAWLRVAKAKDNKDREVGYFLLSMLGKTSEFAIVHILKAIWDARDNEEYVVCLLSSLSNWRTLAVRALPAIEQLVLVQPSLAMVYWRTALSIMEEPQQVVSLGCAILQQEDAITLEMVTFICAMFYRVENIVTILDVLYPKLKAWEIREAIVRLRGVKTFPKNAYQHSFGCLTKALDDVHIEVAYTAACMLTMVRSRFVTHYLEEFLNRGDVLEPMRKNIERAILRLQGDRSIKLTFLKTSEE